jgi:hypothetical protein
MSAIMQALAAIPSTLPRDASTLDASISALKSSISALESSLKTLEGSSTPWEWVAIVSAFVVFAGIIGEIIVIVSEYFEDLHDWRQGVVFWVWRVVLPPGRPPRWRFCFDIVATVVVLLGVLGEASASLKLASINSLLRSKTSELRADSDQLLALITQEAGDAKSSAKSAGISANDAGTNAGIAQEKADTADISAKSAVKQAGELSKKLSAANDEIERLQAKRIELEKSLAPRTFASISKDDIAKLRAFSGTNVVLRYLPDAEAERAASSLMGVLQAAGWKMSQAVPDPSKNTPFFDGVLVTTWEPSNEEIKALPSPSAFFERMQALRKIVDESAKSRRAAEQLVDFLKSHDWTGRSMPSRPEDHFSPDTLVIVVGFKPNPYFDPEQIKQINNMLEQQRQKALENERKEDEIWKNFPQ